MNTKKLRILLKEAKTGGKNVYCLNFGATYRVIATKTIKGSEWLQVGSGSWGLISQFNSFDVR